MNSNSIKILFLVLIIIFGLFLSACRKDTIKFYRESKVQEALKKLDLPDIKKDTIKKSSGVIIYKDNSYQNDSINNNSIKFGPKDPDFNIKVRF